MLKFANANIEETIMKNFNLESKDFTTWINDNCDLSFLAVTLGFISFTNIWAIITDTIAGIADMINIVR